jgi:DNA-binding NarL/FixJ family response regulator
VKKVAICDDHTVVRHALKNIIQSNNNVVVGEAWDHEGILKVLEEHEVDVLVIDIGLPALSGLETISQARKKYPQLKILVFSMYDDHVKIEQAILSGANGYLVKDATAKEINEAIETVANDGFYMQAKIEYLRKELENKLKNNGNDFSSIHPLDKLSKREREVFFLLSEGQANRNIAKKMFLSPRTVETHRARILKKLSLNSTAELVRFAIKNNLLSL